jgi:hypothetical protein
VKAGYNRDSESFKSSLSLLTQKQGSIFNEEKAAIVEFFSRWNVWVWDTLHVDVHEYFHGNYNDLTPKIIKFREAYHATQIAYSKVQLLIRDPNVVMAGHEMVTAALKLHSAIDPIVNNLKRNLTSEKTLIDSFFKQTGKQKGSMTPEETMLNNFYAQQAKENSDERSRLQDNYRTAFAEHFDPAMRKRDVFMELARVYLNTHI